MAIHTPAASAPIPPNALSSRNNRSVPAPVAAAATAASGLIALISATVSHQAATKGDFSVVDVGRLIYSTLPQPGTPEAAVWSLVIGEYLAFCADGIVLTPSFKPGYVKSWRGICSQSQGAAA